MAAVVLMKMMAHCHLNRFREVDRGRGPFVVRRRV